MNINSINSSVFTGKHVQNAQSLDPPKMILPFEEMQEQMVAAMHSDLALLGNRMKKNRILEICLRIAENQAQDQLPCHVENSLNNAIGMVQQYPEPLVVGLGMLFSNGTESTGEKILYKESIEHTFGIGLQTLIKVHAGYRLMMRKSILLHVEENLQEISNEPDKLKILSDWLQKEKEKLACDMNQYRTMCLAEIPSLIQDFTSTWNLIPIPEIAFIFSCTVKVVSYVRSVNQLNEKEIALNTLKSFGEGSLFKTGPMQLPKKPSEEASKASFHVLKNTLLAIADAKKREVIALQEIRNSKSRYDFAVGYGVTFAVLLTKAFMLAGVSIAAVSIIAWIQIAFFGLSVLGLAVGTFYLYRNRPHLFSELLKGTYIALTVNKLRLAWNEFQYRKKMVELYEAPRFLRGRYLEICESYRMRMSCLKNGIASMEKDLEEATFQDLFSEKLKNHFDAFCRVLFNDLKNHQEAVCKLFGIETVENLTEPQLKSLLIHFLTADEAAFQKKYVMK